MMGFSSFVKALYSDPGMVRDLVKIVTNHNITMGNIAIDLGAEYLATVHRWPKLEGLSLQNDRLTDAGLDALLAWPALRQLRYLAIGTNEITSAALERLAHTPGLRLEQIELWQTPAAASARAIFDASPLAGIHVEDGFNYEAPHWLACA